jgi:hypothetical protein
VARFFYSYGVLGTDRYVLPPVGKPGNAATPTTCPAPDK